MLEVSTDLVTHIATGRDTGAAIDRIAWSIPSWMANLVDIKAGLQFSPESLDKKGISDHGVFFNSVSLLSSIKLENQFPGQLSHGKPPCPVVRIHRALLSRRWERIFQKTSFRESSRRCWSLCDGLPFPLNRVRASNNIVRRRFFEPASSFLEIRPHPVETWPEK